MLREQRVSLMTEFGEGATIETLYSECVHSFEEGGVFTEGVGEALKKGADKLKELLQKIIDKIHEILGKTPKKTDKVEINPNVVVDKKELTKIQKIRKVIKKIVNAPADLIYDAYKNHKGALSAAVVAVLGFTTVHLIHASQNADINLDNEIKMGIAKEGMKTLNSLRGELYYFEDLSDDAQRNILSDVRYASQKIDLLNEMRDNVSVANDINFIYTKIAGVINKIISALGTAISKLTKKG